MTFILAFGLLSDGKVSNKCSKDGVGLAGPSGNISSPMYRMFIHPDRPAGGLFQLPKDTEYSSISTHSNWKLA